MGRRLLASALAILLSACKTWEPAPVALETLAGDDRPPVVRVVGAGGERLVLRNPTLANDSLVATTVVAAGAVGVAGASAGARPGLPWEDIRAIEVARVSVWRTVGLVAGIALISAGWAALASDSEGGRPPPQVQLPKE